MPTVALEELVAPDHTVVVLQEVQNGVVGPTSALPALAESARAAGMFEHLRTLTATARAVGVPVIHTTAETLPNGFGANNNARLFAGARRAGAANTPNSDSVAPLAEIDPADSDIVLPRYHGLSPMTGGQLDSLLRNSGITTMVVTGVSLNVAIPNMVFDAVNRSYQVVVVTDAVAGVPPEYGRAVLDNTLRLVATLVTTAELVAAWS